MFFDLNIILFIFFIIIFIFSFYIQIKIKIIYKKYNKIKNKKNITGSNLLNKIKNNYNMENLKIIFNKNNFQNYYDSKKKIINLSEDIFNNSSITSIAVAAHEMGHAEQDLDKNFYIKFKEFLYPVLTFSSKTAIPFLIFGFLFSSFNLIFLGIILYSFLVLFQIILVPIEIDASNRGINFIKNGNYLNNEELKCAKKVLKVAALTYIASMSASIIQLLRFILILINSKE